MSQSDAQAARVKELDDILRPEDDDYFRPPGEPLHGWYARLLSTLTVLTDGEELVYAASFLSDAASARFVVVSDARVVVATLNDRGDGNERVETRSVSRSALRTLGVIAGMRSDIRSPRLQGWPGDLTLHLEHEGLDAPVAVTGDSYDRTAEDQVGSIWKLLDVLRADMRP